MYSGFSEGLNYGYQAGFQIFNLRNFYTFTSYRICADICISLAGMCQPVSSLYTNDSQLNIRMSLPNTLEEKISSLTSMMFNHELSIHIQCNKMGDSCG